MQCSLFEERAVQDEPVERGPMRLTFESVFETPLGWMEATTDGTSLLSLGFCAATEAKTGDALGGEVGRQVVDYFSGERETFELPLRLLGTPFQVRVWKTLQAIPFGTTICYSALAERLGVKNGQRAVGMANRVNPVAIVVPCHRVIQADGQLCGYAGGLWRKQQLLGLESGQRGLF